MIVYKFGGASVKDASGVKNVTSIVRNSKESLVVVISAMGKMTNAFEALLKHWYDGDFNNVSELLNQINEQHTSVIKDLFGDCKGSSRYNQAFELLEGRLSQAPSLHFDFEYDQVVSFGELLSTSIIADYWDKVGLSSGFVSVSSVLKTDDLYRDANVNWELTTDLMHDAFNFEDFDIYLTQGFLGGTLSNLTTTLGREGSDYTAAIIGYALNASRVAIWKDVPGVLNADPRWYPKAVKINELSYLEAIELAFYGAQVIHPKTLKPLQNADIPLYVNSFLTPDKIGTVILNRQGISEQVPVYILKRDQVFVTISPRDFSFIMEDKLIDIISVFRHYRVKMNLMQNSALNFTACFDRVRETDALISKLQEEFLVRYNSDVELITIRQYTENAIIEMTQGREVIDSQTTRKVARFVLKKQ